MAQAWERYHRSRGAIVRWTIEEERDGAKTYRLHLDDGKHSRSEMFVYSIRNNEITKATQYSMNCAHLLLRFSGVLLCLLLFLLTCLGLLIGSIRKRLMKAKTT